MKKLYTIFFVVIVLLCCLAVYTGKSIQSTEKEKKQTFYENGYSKGYNDGYEDVFLNLWQAGDGTEIYLESGKAWETDQFSISITQGEGELDGTIQINLSTSTLTMDECFEDQRLFFNVYSYDGSQFESLLTGELFYMKAVLEEHGDHTAQATVGLYDSTKLVAILMAVDNRIYRAVYYIS